MPSTPDHGRLLARKGGKQPRVPLDVGMHLRYERFGVEPGARRVRALEGLHIYSDIAAQYLAGRESAASHAKGRSGNSTALLRRAAGLPNPLFVPTLRRRSRAGCSGSAASAAAPSPAFEKDGQGVPPHAIATARPSAAQSVALHGKECSSNVALAFAQSRSRPAPTAALNIHNDSPSRASRLPGRRVPRSDLWCAKTHLWPLSCLEERNPKGAPNERHRRVPEEQRGLCRGL